MKTNERACPESYRQWIAEFLAAHAFRDEHGGYQAFEGRLVAGESTFQAERNILVNVRAVLCELPEKKHPSFAGLWFLVRNEARRFGSFAIEAERVIEALENADPSTQIPIPAYEVGDIGNDRVLAGGSILDVRITPARLAAPAGTTRPRFPVAGIRFAVGEAKKPPIYSFAMAGVTPFIALTAALACYDGPTSLALEVDKCEQERRPREIQGGK